MKPSTIPWESCIADMEAFLARSAEQPVRAVLTTFDFDADSFQRTWMRILRRYHAQVVVMADADAMRRTALLPGSLAGFQLVPVAVKGGVFHPKVALVRTKNNVFAALGSGNLTQGGTGGNLELQLTGTTFNQADQSLVYGVTGFLKRLVKFSTAVRIPPTGIRFCNEITADLPEDTQIVMSSLQMPLWNQIIERVGTRKPGNVTLLSPWHAGTGEGPGTEPNILKVIKKHYGNNVTVLTDGNLHNAPKLSVKSVRIYAGRNAEQNKEEGQKLPTGLHAKSIIVRHGKKGWWFLGSANATQPALLRAIGNKGNVEVIAALPLDDVLAKCLDNTWDDLFDEADKQVHMKPSQFTKGSGGIILSGELIHRRNGPVIRLMAFKSNPVNAVLMRTENALQSGRVTVSFDRDGIGEVVGKKNVDNLIPNLLNRQKGSTSYIVYEYYKGKALPVVITVPILLNGEADVDPEIILSDLLHTLKGSWPVARPDIPSSEEEENDGDSDNGTIEDDREMDALTYSDHLGELDRIGRLIAMLIRATHGAFERDRLVETIKGLHIPEEHRKRAILAAITKVSR